MCLQAIQNGTDKAMLFPTLRAGEECVKYMARLADENFTPSSLRIAPFVVQDHHNELRGACNELRMEVVAVVFPPELWKLAKSFWQNTGMGISSRYAERIIGLIREGNSLELLDSQSSTVSFFEREHGSSTDCVSSEYMPRCFRRKVDHAGKDLHVGKWTFKFQVVGR